MLKRSKTLRLTSEFFVYYLGGWTPCVRLKLKRRATAKIVVGVEIRFIL